MLAFAAMITKGKTRFFTAHFSFHLFGAFLKQSRSITSVFSYNFFFLLLPATAILRNCNRNTRTNSFKTYHSVVRILVIPYRRGRRWRSSALYSSKFGSCLVKHVQTAIFNLKLFVQYKILHEPGFTFTEMFTDAILTACVWP